MKKQFVAVVIAASSIASALAMQAKPVAAASLSCNPDYPRLEELVDPRDSNNASMGCEYSTAIKQDKQADINAQLFFGKDDWKFAGKDEGNGSADFNFDEGTTSGTIKLLADEASLPVVVVDLIKNGRQQSVEGEPLPATDLLLSFKDGDGDPTGIVAYLLKVPSSGMYTWTSPFTNSTGNNLDTLKEVSHVSLFYRAPEDGVPIPTPVLLPGLIGMGVAAIRKRRGSAES